MELDAISWRLGKPGETREAESRAGASAPARGEQAVQFEISGRVNATQRNDYRGITAQVQAFAERAGERAATSSRAPSCRSTSPPRAR